jgi:hypothetical protein
MLLRRSHINNAGSNVKSTISKKYTDYLGNRKIKKTPRHSNVNEQEENMSDEKKQCNSTSLFSR